MQNNDFDQRIRQMLEQNEPPFDPAHWDRMEDMLQQLPASPNAGQSAGGSGSVAGSMSAGAKAIAIAAAVVVTGVNVAIYNSDSGSSKEMAPVEQSAAAAQADQVSAENPGLQAEQVSEVAFHSEQTVSSETGPVGNHQSKASHAVSVKADNSVNSLPASPPVPFAGNNPVINPFSGGESNNSILQNPCGINRKGILPYLVLHSDTIRNLQVELNACEPQCLLLPAHNGVTVSWSDAVSSLPGASFLINEQTGVGSLCWTPTADQARSEPYTVQMGARDSRCPDAALSFAISISIKSAISVQLIGDSVVKAGERAHLQLLQVPTGATLRWRKAGEEWLTEQSTSLEISPVANAVYQAQITMPNGCSRVLSQKIRVENPDLKAFIPNIFTPDGDGINDRFILKGLTDGGASVEIFDRWGKRVYYNEYYDNSWDADGLADGYYTYQITDLTSRKVYKAGVTISRNH